MTTSTETNSEKFWSDITFIIHYRKDCDDRAKNLSRSLNYLAYKFPESQKIVVNDDKIYDKEVTEICFDVRNSHILFLQNDDEFRKTLSFNQASEIAKGSVLCFWDVDVLIKESSIKDSYLDIAFNLSDHVYPFNGTFIDVQKDLFQDFLTRYNFEYIEKLWEHKHPSLHFASDQSPGGCTMISKKAFERMGRYDNRFIGWGFEDTDFLYRSRRVNRVKYLKDKDAICWHLHHENAKRMENPHYHNNLLIFNQNNASR